MDLRFAIDTGGTFTDLIVAGPNHALAMFKAATTPADPLVGVIDSLKIAADAVGLALPDFLARGEMLVHGTTHAINAIITGNTARTAFLTTAGHPDILVFREGGRMEPFNFTVPYPEPLVPKALTFEIPERIMADGSVRLPLDRARATQIIQRLASLEVEAVAVCFLWSVVNPQHELKIAELLEEYLPNIPYTLSHRVNPSIREYRRASSTCLDASLKPIMGSYMKGLDARLRDEGFRGRLLIVTSQGGVMDAADAAEVPVNLINSGPSMAPVAARSYGETDGTRTLIVGDTGGTTFDVSVVFDGHIPQTRETWLGQPFRSHMTGMPSVDVKSVGAGGGSIAWVDAGGLLHVGPQSAGAVPGPACYGAGGTRPTVTDAALVLGYIDPRYFLGGRMQLDHAAAVQAIESQVAAPIGQGVREAALAIMELATEHMVQAIMAITVNQGVDPTKAIFVAGGGAAGLNCVAIGRRLGCRRVIVPEAGAALSAAGALISDLTWTSRSIHHTHSDRFDRNGVNATLDRLETDCRRFAEGPGASATSVTMSWATEARYPDQAWEIEVPLRTDRFAASRDVAVLVEDFHATHEKIFAVSDPASPIEAVAWVAEVRCQIGSGSVGRLCAEQSTIELPSRELCLSGAIVQSAPVYRFEAIPDGTVLDGPAIIESGFTTVVLDERSRAMRDANGTIVIELDEVHP